VAVLVVIVVVAIFFLRGRIGPLAAFGREVDDAAHARNKRFEAKFERPRDETNLL